MTTPAQTDRSAAFIAGFIVGLRAPESTRYGYSNPYDRRKITGKEWETGKEAGQQVRCSQGAQYAEQELARLRGEV